MRTPLENEQIVIAYLLDLAGIAIDAGSLIVRPMEDGGMGSLAIAPFEEGRAFGSEAAQCHFCDIDEVPVSATLNLDQKGRPFELDVWRVDFQPTVGWPLNIELYPGPPNADRWPHRPRGMA